MIEFLGRNLHFIILTDYNRTRGDNPLLEEDCFYISYKNILEENEANMTCLDSLVLAETPGGVLDISLGGEVQPGPLYPDPV